MNVFRSCLLMLGYYVQSNQNDFTVSYLCLNMFRNIHKKIYIIYKQELMEKSRGIERELTSILYIVLYYIRKFGLLRVIQL